jgi:UDPglucose 6-dehydrogenase
VLVLTEWREFVELDPADLAATVRAKVIVDGRNCLDVDRWTGAGWSVYCLGRGRVTASAEAPAAAPRS